MLAIRLQRGGRKGHAQYRMIVQESRRTPTSGNVVALVGQYNPHTKAIVVDVEKAEFYLKNGAQPSDRVARLLKKEGVKLPKWVQLSPDKKRTIRNPDKMRSNRPAEEKQAEPAAEAVELPEEAAVEDEEQAETEAAPAEVDSPSETAKADKSKEAADEPESVAA